MDNVKASLKPSGKNIMTGGLVGLFKGGEDDAPGPTPPPPIPTPTIDESMRSRDAADDNFRRRKGRAATVFAGASGKEPATTSASKVLLGG